MNPPTRPRSKRLTAQELQVIKQIVDSLDSHYTKVLDIYYRLNIPVADDVALMALNQSLDLARRMSADILSRHNVRF